MKQMMQAFPLAALMAARASAQATTAGNDPSEAEAVTSYFTTCPPSTTTVTLSTTTTICPGPGCGGTTTVLYDSQLITSIGTDGRTTIYEPYEYTAPCPCDGGVCDAVYTVTRECPCTAAHQPTEVPAGFTTSVMACSVCAQNGGPSSVTIVTPVANGPYATQTPVMGSAYNGAYASAGANAYASAGPNGAIASAGATAIASAGNGYASANANANANANAGSGNVDASANANANVNANGEASSTNVPTSLNSVWTSGSNTTGTSPPIASFTGSANRAVYAVSAIIGGVIGSLAVLL